MANCQDFHITLHNSTDGEIKVTKFEYRDGTNFKTENMFGVDGHQKIEKDHGVVFKRNLEGIGDETTVFRVTFKHHVGGTLWGDDNVQTTDSFVAHDNGSRTVTLTSNIH